MDRFIYVLYKFACFVNPKNKDPETSAGLSSLIISFWLTFSIIYPILTNGGIVTKIIVTRTFAVYWGIWGLPLVVYIALRAKKVKLKFAHVSRDVLIKWYILTVLAIALIGMIGTLNLLGVIKLW